MTTRRPLLLLLLLVSVVLLFIQQRPTTDKTKQAAAFENNYVLSGFQTKRFNEQGLPETLIQGKQLNQPVNTREHHIQSPHVTLLESNVPHWKVSAGEGKLNQDDHQASLSGGVEIIGTETAPLSIKTEEIKMDMRTQLASGEKRVTITQGKNSLTGVGLEADLKKTKLKLISQTESVYVVE